MTVKLSIILAFLVGIVGVRAFINAAEGNTGKAGLYGGLTLVLLVAFVGAHQP